MFLCQQRLALLCGLCIKDDHPLWLTDEMIRKDGQRKTWFADKGIEDSIGLFGQEARWCDCI
jgi:hypothetical protein